MTLDELAIKHGTDKNSSSHWYTRHYEKFFGEIRLSVESVCEIGIGNGASLKMWRDYFPNAIVHGVDINGCSNDLGERICVHSSDQTDCQTLTDSLGDKNLEIIVDDASHDPEPTYKTLECLWPILRSKGWYVIEDMNKNTFPPWIGQWCSDHQAEVRQCLMIDNQGHGCVICFLQKR